MAEKMRLDALKKAVKSELVELSGDEKKVTNVDAENALKAVISAIASGLSGGNNVGINGFGTFEIRERSARKGRNPQTGEEMDIPASVGVGFKASSTLKDNMKST